MTLLNPAALQVLSSKNARNMRVNKIGGYYDQNMIGKEVLRKSLNFNKYLALHLVEMVFLYCGFLQVWKSIWHGLDLDGKDKTLFRKVQKGSLAIVWCAIVNRNWKCFITYVVLDRLSMHPADFRFILTRKSKLLRYCEIAGYCCHSIVWIWFGFD